MTSFYPSCIFSLACCVGLASMAASASASAFPIAETQIVTVLEAAGLPAGAAHVQLPGPLFSNVPTPALRLTSAEMLADGMMRVRLACRQQAECGAFFAKVSFKGQALDLSKLLTMAGSTRLGEASPTQAPASSKLRVGQHVTLVLEDNRMRITLPVVAIDSGTMGTQVRVRDLEHGQVFQAVVTQAGQVEAILP